MRNEIRVSRDGNVARELRVVDASKRVYEDPRGPGGQVQYYWWDPTPVSLVSTGAIMVQETQEVLDEVVRRGGEPLRAEAYAFRPLDMHRVRFGLPEKRIEDRVTPHVPTLFEFHLFHESENTRIFETFYVWDIMFQSLNYCAWPTVMFSRRPESVQPQRTGVSRVHVNPQASVKAVGNCTDPLGRPTSLSFIDQVDWHATLVRPQEVMVEMLAEFILENQPSEDDMRLLNSFMLEHGVRATDVSLHALTN